MIDQSLPAEFGGHPFPHFRFFLPNMIISTWISQTSHVKFSVTDCVTSPFLTEIFFFSVTNLVDQDSSIK